jgi:hypothetical protein
MNNAIIGRETSAADRPLITVMKDGGPVFYRFAVPGEL